MKIHALQQPDLHDIISITEKLRLEKEKEHIYLIKKNRVIAWFEGDKNSVNPPKEQLVRFSDALILHNYPNGTSFSFDDIKNVIETNVKEIRLINEKNTFILKRPGNNWNIDFKNQEIETVYNELLIDINKRLEELYSQGKITGAEINFSIDHFLWQAFFTKFGIEYKKF